MEEIKEEKVFIPFLLPIRCVLFVLAFLFLYLVTNQEFNNLSKWWSIIASICNIITIAILLLYCFKKKTSYFKLLNFEKGKTKVWTCIYISLIIIAIGMVGMYLAGLVCYGQFPYMAKMMIEPIPLWLAGLNTLVLPITTTIAEDGLYLGYAINRSNKKWSAILPAMFFYAFQHSFIPFLPDIVFILYRFISFLPCTFVMCFWYQKNRNPLPFMIGHFIINLATVAQILIMSIMPEWFNSL